MSPHHRRSMPSRDRRPPQPGRLDRLFEQLVSLTRGISGVSRRTALLLSGAGGLLLLVVWLVLISLPDRPDSNTDTAKTGIAVGDEPERYAAALAHVERYAQDRVASLYHDTPTFGKAELIRSVTAALETERAAPPLPGGPSLWYDELQQYDFARVFIYHRGETGLTFCISTQSGSLAGVEAFGQAILTALGPIIARYFIIDYQRNAIPQPELVASLPDCLDRLSGPGALIRLGPWGRCDGLTGVLCGGKSADRQPAE